MTSHTKPAIGDQVRLNDFGLRLIYGSELGLGFIKQKVMRITDVDVQSLTAPEETFGVEVDDPEINAFLLIHRCFDIVERAITPL